MAATEDGRIAFIYQEALRGLMQQQAALESLRNRTGTLIFAASFASSLLGSKALERGLSLWVWAGVSIMLGIGILTVIILWPYYHLSFRFDAKQLLDDYVDNDNSASLDTMQRDLALRARNDGIQNGRIVKRLRRTFEVALILLLLEILVWMLAIHYSN
jgi:hypothetical protein